MGAVAAAGGVVFEVGLLAIGLIFAGIGVWGLLSLLIMKELTALEFVLYVAGLLFIVGLGILNWKTPLMWASVALAMSLGISFPWMRKWGSERAIHSIEQADLLEHKMRIARRPRIPYSYKRIADIYYKWRQWDQSAEWYEKYEELTGDKGVEMRLRHSREMLEHGGKSRRVCPDCEHVSPPDSRYCSKCGTVLPGRYEILQLFHGKRGTTHVMVATVSLLLTGILLSLFTSASFMFPLLCFWTASAAFVYFLYKRIVLY